jgi:hypothetical protein
VTANAKAACAGRGLAIAARPAPPGASRPSTCPAPPIAIRAAAETPRGSPTLAASGETTPLSAHQPAGGEGEVKGEEGGIGAARGSTVRSEDQSRPWEEPDPPSSSAPASTASSTSTPSRCRRLRLPPRRQAPPPHFTNACTTARGHQGEDEHSPALVDAPAFEPSGNVSPHRAAAPPPLVMPAIEPGWVKSLAGAAAFVNARAPFCLA